MHTSSDAQPEVRGGATVQRIEAAVLFGALTLIAAIVFGTLSIHPF